MGRFNIETVVIYSEEKKKKKIVRGARPIIIKNSPLLNKNKKTKKTKNKKKWFLPLRSPPTLSLSPATAKRMP
jgi:hypothetical protein